VLQIRNREQRSGENLPAAPGAGELLLDHSVPRLTLLDDAADPLDRQQEQQHEKSDEEHLCDERLAARFD
jgi:hypothetical protein